MEGGGAGGRWQLFQRTDFVPRRFVLFAARLPGCLPSFQRQLEAAALVPCLWADWFGELSSSRIHLI